MILMDLELAGMTGVDLTRKIKSDVKYKEIIILAVTACAMKADKEKALAAGVNAYITKPIDTLSLLETISKFLDKK